MGRRMFCKGSVVQAPTHHVDDAQVIPHASSRSNLISAKHRAGSTSLQALGGGPHHATLRGPTRRLRHALQHIRIRHDV